MEAKLIERMKRLLAMSQDAGSENEALIAAKRLHAMLSKHGMSMADLADRSEEVDRDSWMTKNRPYARQIAAGIAKLYYCEMYYIRGVDKKQAPFVFVGKEHHRQIAMTIAQQVIRIIDSESVRESKRRTGGRDTNFINSFRNGAANRIVQRCMELIREARAGRLTDEETGENLPVLAPLYDREAAAVAAFMADMDLKVGKTPRNTARGIEGVNAGHEAANRVALHQGISKTAPKLIQ